MFDPWTATEEEMLERMDKFFSCPQANLEIRQWASAKHILNLKSRIEAGEGWAVLDATNSLLSCGLIAPDWLADAFNWRYQAGVGLHVGSWDDVFDKPHRYDTGTKRLALARRKSGLPVSIWAFIRTRLGEDPSLPLDALFAESADRFAISAREADRHYRIAVAAFWEPKEVAARKHK